MPPSYIRVRAVVWAYDRGQTHRHTDTHTDARDHNNLHFALSTTHAKCNKLYYYHDVIREHTLSMDSDGQNDAMRHMPLTILLVPIAGNR